MKLHETLTKDRIEEAYASSMLDLSSPGFCVDCGEEADGVEPDATKYRCESCGARAVYGAEELLMYM